MSKEREPYGSHVRTIFATLGLAVVGAVVVASGVIYSGVYDVSAASGHNPVVAWLLHATYEQSLHRHAVGAVVPSDLMDDSNIKAGAELYRSTCAQCHGVPGETLSPVGQGILPLAPKLLSATRRNNPPIMFWVIKNGVKMTAMPAFGKTWDDKQIWQMTAFLNKGRGISAKDYAALSAGAGPVK
jgi:mono/diheme cytochrome c family protein